ncbi:MULTISPECIES: FAD-dependent oxidoreductase [unclassified Mesorhizobium]|uniref:NAD(P)/FAD-dependent oxidoreductase n=1 Tax=unclassified Mesorhizobium TaxID=325217 RepID=UPI00112749AE|nr:MULTISPECIES: FAD-dependent oxidoreductase [unclassified Mesorhizobium]TPK95329.1 FAD-binding oxidoreductase [Mesorhizobium sp. B2-4-16]TPL61023.1 FAD-binding oxidoreductase [Mesorhizobium sp. B2-4-3]
MKADVIVIGGGTVGAAIAYGLAQRQQHVIVLDGDDRDHRAARANFGLVWVQGKGTNMPEYQLWSRRSCERWADFSKGLLDITGQDLHLEQKGGLVFCLGDAEFEARRTTLQKLHNQLGGEPADCEMIDRSELERIMPGVAFGSEVYGASLGHRDGHANPLRLLSALHAGIQRLGGTIVSATLVEKIQSNSSGFTLGAGLENYVAPRIVIAAGLGSQKLGALVGLDVPLRPQRGQILVTERFVPILPLPCSGLRQTREGTVMIGATQEDVGLDAATTAVAAAKLSTRALRIIPALATATLVRQWAGLRVLTPDGCPVYAQSESHPGAFVALCHSGVTLAAVHAETIAQAVIDGSLPSSLDVFHQRRFDVPEAA